jgi:hypothetical protein
MSRWGPASLAAGVDLEGLKVVLQAGARMLALPDEAVTVLTLTGDEQLRDYNRRYRGLDETSSSRCRGRDARRAKRVTR